MNLIFDYVHDPLWSFGRILVYECDLITGISDGNITTGYENHIVEVIFYRGGFVEEFFRDYIANYKYLKVVGKELLTSNPSFQIDREASA